MILHLEIEMYMFSRSTLIVLQNLLFVWRMEVFLVKVELRSSTAIGGVPCVVVATGGLRKL